MEVLENQFSWYTLKCTSNQEKTMKERILKRIAEENLSEYVTNIVIPTEKEIKVVNGKKVLKERNVMPGYLLVQMDANHGEILPLFKKITGTFGFLSEGKDKKPVAMRNNEMLRFLNIEQELTINLDNIWYVNETVKILTGPFSGFKGTINKIDMDKNKAVIAVSIFGRETLVDIEANNIEKVG